MIKKWKRSIGLKTVSYKFYTFIFLKNFFNNQKLMLENI